MRMEAVRGPDAGTLLVRAIRAQAAAAGVVVAVRSIADRPWASATFVGTRHEVALDAQPAIARDRWIAGLAEAEWTIRGHLVADVVVDRVVDTGGDAALSMSILTIEDN